MATVETRSEPYDETKKYGCGQTLHAWRRSSEFLSWKWEQSPRNLGSENDCGRIRTTNLLITSKALQPPGYRLQLQKRQKIFGIYALCLLMYM